MGLIIKKGIIKYLISIVLIMNGLLVYSSSDSLKLLFSKKSKTEKLSLLVEISKNYLSLNSDSAILFANLGLEYGKQFSDDSYIPDFLQLIGYAKFYKGDFNYAISVLNQALIISEKRNNKRKVSDITLFIGDVYKETYNHVKALTYYYMALKLYSLSKDSLSVSLVNNKIGLLYYRLGDHKKAIFYLKESLNNFKLNEISTDLANTLCSLSLIYKDQLQYNTALFYLLEYQGVSMKLNDKASLINAKEKIGECYLLSKDYIKAKKYFDEALELSHNSSDKIKEISILCNCAILNLSAKKYFNAKNNLELADSLNKQLQDINAERKIYKLYSEYYKNNNDYCNALIYYKLYKKSNDSIFVIENNKKLAKLKMQYETTNFAVENELLKQNGRISEIKIQKGIYLKNIFIVVSVIISLIVFLFIYRFWLKKKDTKALLEKKKLINNQRRSLEEANTTKDKFFSIIAHDLKNPFFNFKQYSNLLLENKQSDSLVKQEIINDLKAISDDTYSLLENLLIWANSQSKMIQINKTDINLLNLINESIRPYRISSVEKHIKVEVSVDSEMQIFADKFTFATVIGNMFYNAVKFTNINGNIKISAKTENEYHIISISDDGVGIAENKIGNLFKVGKNTSSNGTNNEKGTGLGLIICMEFVKMNNGEIEVESLVNKGTTFNIFLKCR